MLTADHLCAARVSATFGIARSYRFPGLLRNRLVQYTHDYDFSLPDHLIARHPPAERSGARMLVVHRASGQFEHRSFTDLPGYLAPGDLAVLNDARVIPARVAATTAAGGALELFVVERPEPTRWICLVRPGRKARVGAGVRVGPVRGQVEAVLPGDGLRVIVFDSPLELADHGTIPLPPYLGRAAEPTVAERYQTVYARAPGAVAAPTAGLHFTPEILACMPHVFVTLHVGLGTFRPVQVETLSAHRMHAERFEIAPTAASAINDATARNGRIFAVGTTTVRVLEGCLRAPDGSMIAQAGQTDLFLHPPTRVRRADALLTNFHLPRSTLLMLVSAMAGNLELVLAAYREAVRLEYRFYSYGDCMLVLD